MMRFFCLFLSLLSLCGVVSGDSSVVDTELNSAYNSFSKVPASTKVTLARTMLTKTQYTTIPSLNWNINIGGFAKKFKGNEQLKSIQTQSFIDVVNVEKPVHRYGVAATVEYRLLSGTPPRDLFPILTAQTPEVGVIRFSSGQPTSVIGVGLAVFGNQDDVRTRVFSAETKETTKYHINITQQTFGVTAQGAEGRLWFQPAPSIYHADIGDNINHDFRQDFFTVSQGAVVGYVISAPNEYPGVPFNVSVTITTPLMASQAADQNWHFRRTLKEFDALGTIFLWGLSVIAFFGHPVPGVNLFDVNVEQALNAGCPFANPNANIMNQATIAAIVIASVTTVVAIVATTMLIKQRKENQQVKSMPLELKA